MSGVQPDKIHVSLNNVLTVLAVMLSSVVKGMSEKAGPAGAGGIKPAMGAGASSPDMAVKPSENQGPVCGFAVVKTMKVIMDAMVSAFMSGTMAMAMVALKYYVVNAVENFVESMTGYGYADDP